MQNLIDRITKSEEATELVQNSADQEKEKIEAEIKAKKKKFDDDIEKETEIRIETIRQRFREQAEQKLRNQREQANKMEELMEKIYNENHIRFSDEIVERIVRG